MIVTGPTTHQSPLANWPVGRSAEKVQVMPNCDAEVAADADIPEVVKNSEAPNMRAFKSIKFLNIASRIDD